MKRLAIVGAGGHGKVVADTADATGQWDEIVFFDSQWPQRQRVADWAVLGNDDRLILDRDTFAGAVVAIGHNLARWQWQLRLQHHGVRLATVVHPTAWVSPRATVGQGTVIFAGAVVQAGAHLGQACIINTGASVDHDCVLGHASHLSPGARLGGTVTLGERCWIGVGASVRNNLTLGSDCTVGVGAAVIASAGDALTLVGVPARPLRRSPSC